MNRVVSAAVAVVAACAIAPAHAESGRTVEGSIIAPTFRISAIPNQTVPVVGNPSNSNGVYFRQARCAYVLGGADSNGLVGYVVELTEDEGDGEHTFTASSSAGNLSVQFYEDLGTCENQPPSSPSPDPGGLFDTEGDEEGAIPFFASHAIIVVEDANQVDITFTTAPAEQG